MFHVKQAVKNGEQARMDVVAYWWRCSRDRPQATCRFACVSAADSDTSERWRLISD